MKKRSLLPLILLTMAACNKGEKGEWVETSACMTVAEDATSCPSSDEVQSSELWVSGWCADEIKSVEGQGTLLLADDEADTGFNDSNKCCYPVVARNTEPDCAIGRPFQEQGQAKVAAFQGPTPQTPLAKAWLEAARMEHASVAAFSRLTLDLMAVGAPLPLLAQVQAAALDEVEHARITFALASGLAGTELSPGPLSFSEAIAPRTDMAAIAFDAVVEGCIGETIGAYLARRVAQDLPPGEQRDVLEALADDEERHAALSWGVVAWLLREGGEPVRAAVESALQQPTEVGGVMAILAGEDLAGLLEQGGREILDPAARALLAA